jgi:hypothetical protein
MGADSGGQRAAALYSLIGTAKLNGLDPAFYLRTVLASIAQHPIIRCPPKNKWTLLDKTLSSGQEAKRGTSAFNYPQFLAGLVSY